MDIRSGQVRSGQVRSEQSRAEQSRFSFYWTISHRLELQGWYATQAKWIGMVHDGCGKEESGKKET